MELPSLDDGGRRRATRWACLRARVEGTRVPRTVPRDDATGTPDGAPPPPVLITGSVPAGADARRSESLSILPWHHDDTRFLNRELSWLQFDERVLAIAEDATLPLLERVKFVAIFTSNLDEFFQVRVAGLHEQVAVEAVGNNAYSISPAD